VRQLRERGGCWEDGGSFVGEERPRAAAEAQKSQKRRVDTIQGGEGIFALDSKGQGGKSSLKMGETRDGKGVLTPEKEA